MMVEIWIIVVIIALFVLGAVGAQVMFILRSMAAVFGNLPILSVTLPFEDKFHYGVLEQTLITSASNGHLQVVEWLLSESDHLSYNLCTLRRTLSAAIRAGHAHVAERLLMKPILLWDTHDQFLELLNANPHLPSVRERLLYIDGLFDHTDPRRFLNNHIIRNNNKDIELLFFKNEACRNDADFCCNAMRRALLWERNELAIDLLVKTAASTSPLFKHLVKKHNVIKHKWNQMLKERVDLFGHIVSLARTKEGTVTLDHVLHIYSKLPGMQIPVQTGENNFKTMTNIIFEKAETYAYESSKKTW